MKMTAQKIQEKKEKLMLKEKLALDNPKHTKLPAWDKLSFNNYTSAGKRKK